MKIFLVSAFFFVCSFANGQEFWLLPSKFKCTVGEELKIDFLKGENFVGESWTSNKSPFEKIELHQVTKQTELNNQSDIEKSKLKIKLTEEGTYQLSVGSNDTVMEKSV